ncbi:hypothetical protein CDAR_606531 [Caerostris darwini]|uniref:Uncharacterized protein n=1 Tax=Caerostris darwini TaxID=1538125 RepID=A0AAV4P9U8_9ARAC|nr:hypothetical protein CDAR_606531 [Caerostris darwini]
MMNEAEMRAYIKDGKTTARGPTPSRRKWDPYPHYNLGPSGDLLTYPLQVFSLAPKVGPVPTHYNLHPSGDSTYLQQLWRLTSLTDVLSSPMDPWGPVPI